MTDQPIITNPEDLGLEVERVRNSVPKGGAYAGWQSLDAIYTAKKGFPLVIYGAPHSGKSVFMLNLCVNLAKEHGWKCLVFSSEQGSVADLILEVAEIYLRKPLRRYTERGQERINVASDTEHIMAQQWVAKHFRFIDPRTPAVKASAWETSTHGVKRQRLMASRLMSLSVTHSMTWTCSSAIWRQTGSVAHCSAQDSTGMWPCVTIAWTSWSITLPSSRAQ